MDSFETRDINGNIVKVNYNRNTRHITRTTTQEAQGSTLQVSKSRTPSKARLRPIVKSVPHKGYHFMTLSDGRVVEIEDGQQAQLSQDNHTDWGHQQGLLAALLLTELHKLEEAEKEAAAVVHGVSRFAFPSTYAGALYNTAVNGTNFADNVVLGNGFGNDNVNLAFDLASPFAWSAGAKAFNAGARFANTARLARTMNSELNNLSHLRLNVPSSLTSRSIPYNIRFSTQRGIPLFDFLMAKDRLDFIKAFNEFADKYGYDRLPEGIGMREAEHLARKMLNRHNQYFRGVKVPGKSTDQYQAIVERLGREPTDEEILRIAATEGNIEEGVGEVWISPDSNAGMYGSHLALIRRPFTLGPNKINWFKEGDFLIIPRTSDAFSVYTPGTIMAPWSYTPVQLNTYLEDLSRLGNEGIASTSELTYNSAKQPLQFVQWMDRYNVPKTATSRNTGAFRVNTSDRFIGSLYHDKYHFKQGGKLIKNNDL